MHDHWTQTLKLVASRGLAAGWKQLQQATLNINTGTKHWQVLQLPTGSGKTEALKVLCSVQDFITHPGILIVSKFRTEADQLAERINELSASRMARSVHQKSTGTNDELGFSPVLVTTHAAYRLALQEIAYTNLTNKSDRLLAHGGGRRAWIVIDEAFDWHDAYSLNISNLRAMSGDLRRAMQGDDRAIAEHLHDFACRLTEPDHNGRSDRPVSLDCFAMLAGIDLNGLRDGVSAIAENALATWAGVEPATDTTSSMRVERPSREHYLRQLDDLRKIACIGHGWVSRRGGLAQLHSARSLIGVDGMSGVILDATAEIDPIYSVMGRHVAVLPRPLGIRSYRNATLHVSYGHKVGKEHLARYAAKEWAVVWGDLSKRMAGKQAFVCAHKDALNTIREYGQTEASLHFGNWGNLDGKNDWNTCGAAILFGLPYLDDIEPAQRFIAHQGPQSNDWFNGSRKYEDHTDIRIALGDGFVSRSVVQAINRARCRMPIDAEGNCLPTDIYLLLPAGKTGEAVVRAIKQQMSGIRIAEWMCGAAKRQARKVLTEVKLTGHFETADPGYYSKSGIATALRISPSSLERMATKLLHGTSAFARKLSGYGVSYHSQTGRGKEAHFIKQ